MTPAALSTTTPGLEAPRALAGGLPATPALLLGPYYPLRATGGAALWTGQQPPADASLLILNGRVLCRQGRPVAGAEVELWHADPAGRYRHPSAPGSAEVLTDFAGYGRVQTDSQGNFSFTSLVPGAYGDGSTLRTPHLHLQITGRFDRLVTQLFLPGHPGNANDRWYQAARHRDRLTAEAVAITSGALHLRWTAVLNQG